MRKGWLAFRFLDADLQEELGILTTEVRARQAAQHAASSRAGDTARPGNGSRRAPVVPAVRKASTSARPASSAAG